jgi:hypothetical protein
MKQRHTHQEILTYADPSLLMENINRVDEIYLWFVKLKEEADAPAVR